MQLKFGLIAAAILSPTASIIAHQGEAKAVELKLMEKVGVV